MLLTSMFKCLFSCISNISPKRKRIRNKTYIFSSNIKVSSGIEEFKLYKFTNLVNKIGCAIKKSINESK